MKNFRNELSRLPEKPGVYLMKDKNDTIIYVGKAKNLKNRVKSYFNKDKNKHMKVLKMVEKVDHFEYIIVENEVEALILESNFIKEHRPHYNILLRDDKQYPYIMVTREKYPRVMKVRRVKNDGNFYYGPYPNAFAVNDIIDLLRDSFKIRTCNLNFDKGQGLKRPCLNYFIDKCPAPCVGLADEASYMENIEQIKAFLNGKEEILTSYLEREMKAAAAKLQFEQAAKYRDSMVSVEQIMARQKITSTSNDDLDLIALYKKDNYVTIQVFFMRTGKVIDRQHFIMENNYDESNEEIMSSFMKQFYVSMTNVAKEILVEFMPADHEVIEELLSEKRASKVSLRVPQRGDKSDLLKMVRANAYDMMMEFFKKKEDRERSKSLGLKHLEETLDLYPLERIEAYDISNTSGVQSVGSMVVYEMGEKTPKEYRKFKIRTVEGPDDYASMREVLTRRLKRGIKEEVNLNINTGFGKMPSLIIMDGGKGQVNVALEVIRDLGLSIPVIGLVKDDKHTTDAIIYNNERIPLKRNSALYRFLYQIQEEVHRFAINYHNQLRKKSMLTSELTKIDGVGNKRMQNLMKHFKTLDRIKKASVSELMECESINNQVAENIYKYFRMEE